MTQFHFAEHIPDLIQPEEYATDPHGRRVRLRIRRTAQGIEILGDAMRPHELEARLQRLGVETIEQMLCG